MASGFLPTDNRIANSGEHSEMNILAMRLGPGKHLQGRTLLGGVIKTEEFDHFHEVRKLCYCEWANVLTLHSLL